MRWIQPGLAAFRLTRSECGESRLIARTNRCTRLGDDRLGARFNVGECVRGKAGEERFYRLSVLSWKSLRKTEALATGKGNFRRCFKSIDDGGGSFAEVFLSDVGVTNEGGRLIFATLIEMLMMPGSP